MRKLLSLSVIISLAALGCGKKDSPTGTGTGTGTGNLPVPGVSPTVPPGPGGTGPGIGVGPKATTLVAKKATVTVEAGKEEVVEFTAGGDDAGKITGFDIKVSDKDGKDVAETAKIKVTASPDDAKGAVKVSTDATTPPGDYTLKVTAKGATATTSVSLKVTPKAGAGAGGGAATLTASKPALTVDAGKEDSTEITVGGDEADKVTDLKVVVKDKDGKEITDLAKEKIKVDAGKPANKKATIKVSADAAAAGGDYTVTVSGGTAKPVDVKVKVNKKSA